MALPFAATPKALTRNVLKKKSKSFGDLAQHRTNTLTSLEDQPWATCHYNTYTHGMAKTSLALPERTTNRVPPPLPPFSTHALSTSHNTTVTPAANHTHIDEIKGHSDVTIPAPPPRRYSLSELQDLSKLPQDSMVCSPSGNSLSLEQAKARSDRPLSIEQRQQAIQRKVAEKQAAERAAQREAKRLGHSTEVVGNYEKKAKGTLGERVKGKWERFLDSFCFHAREE